MNGSLHTFDTENAVRRQLMDFPFSRRAKMLRGLSMLPLFRTQVEGLQQGSVWRRPLDSGTVASQRALGEGLSRLR